MKVGDKVILKETKSNWLDYKIYRGSKVIIDKITKKGYNIKDSTGLLIKNVSADCLSPFTLLTNEGAV